MSKISIMQAVSLRLRFRAGEKLRDLARELNVGEKIASQINTNRLYRPIVEVDLGDDTFAKAYQAADRRNMSLEKYIKSLVDDAVGSKKR